MVVFMTSSSLDHPVGLYKTMPLQRAGVVTADTRSDPDASWNQEWWPPGNVQVGTPRRCCGRVVPLRDISLVGIDLSNVDGLPNNAIVVIRRRDTR